MHIIPAYGRDYKSKKEVEEAWNAGKDFIISDISAGASDGRYINKEDALNHKIKEVNIRYKKLTQVVVIKVEE